MSPSSLTPPTQLKKLPASVLFACTSNSIRSPMAEAMLKHMLGHRIYVDSVGVRAGEQDGFSVTVMDEIGLDLQSHKPKTFDDMEDTSYDLIISMSPQAQHAAVELTRHMASELVFWPVFDPSLIEGSRERRLAAYREVRDEIYKLIQKTFLVDLKPVQE